MFLWDQKTGDQWGIVEGNQVVRLSDSKRFDLVGTNLIDPETKKTVFHLEYFEPLR